MKRGNARPLASADAASTSREPADTWPEPTCLPGPRLPVNVQRWLNAWVQGDADALASVSTEDLQVRQHGVALQGLPAVEAALAVRRRKDAEALNVAAVKRLGEEYHVRVVHPSAAEGRARVLDYRLRVLDEAVTQVDLDVAKSSTTTPDGSPPATIARMPPQGHVQDEP
jgi:hypothetical protein